MNSLGWAGGISAEHNNRCLGLAQEAQDLTGEGRLPHTRKDILVAVDGEGTTRSQRAGELGRNSQEQNGAGSILRSGPEARKQPHVEPTSISIFDLRECFDCKYHLLRAHCVNFPH